MSDVVEGLHAVTVHVRDIHKARAFYRDVLGLEERGFDEKAQRLVFGLPRSSTLLTMHIMAPGEEGRDPGTVSGIVFHHPDPRAATELVRKRGGAVTMEAQQVDHPLGKFYRSGIADPDGNEFIISSRVD